MNGLIIYKKYVDFIYYTNNVLIKFPKVEKMGLVSEIKNNIYNSVKLIMLFDKFKDKVYLEKLDIELRMLIVYIRVSYRSRYITKSNFNTFIKKIDEINKLRIGLINSEK